MTASFTAPPIAPLPDRPTRLDDVKREWTRLGYGLFIHFGLNTYDGRGWGDGRSPASRFAPGRLNCRQWMELAADAGMKYAVLTAKHHDGFCLWPTAQTEYCVREAGVRRDVVGEFVDACRECGIQPGLYYSLWDCNCPFYADDQAYAQYMQAQIGELLTDYGPLVELWFDGGWDKEHPTRKWPFDPAWRRTEDPAVLAGSRWRWRELYHLIHRLQPQCLVVNNSSSDRPGQPRYLPVDIRTSEHFDFVYGDRLHDVDMQKHVVADCGREVYLPLEYCTTINPDWFWVEDRPYSHPSAAAIADWRRRAKAAGGNLLLNIGPNRDGLIPPYHFRYLQEASRIFADEQARGTEAGAGGHGRPNQ